MLPHAKQARLSALCFYQLSVKTVCIFYAEVYRFAALVQRYRKASDTFEVSDTGYLADVC